MIPTQGFVLPAAAAKRLMEEPVGALAPVSGGETARRDVRLLDTFDEGVVASGRLLADAADGLLLMGHGSDIRQPALAGTQDGASDAARGAGPVGALPAGPVKAALADVSSLRALLPLGTAEMQEIRVNFVDDEEKTRVRGRLVSLAAQGAPGVTLVQVQGLRGYDKARLQLAEHLAALGGAPLHETSLYAQVFPGHRSYCAKPEITITQDEAAHDAASDIIRTYLPVARANEAGIIADHDIEFLHDYRIALRKIRSVLSLFTGVYTDEVTADLKARFSALMARTGDLRDLDVYLAEKDGFFDLLPPSMHGGLEHLFHLFERQRAEAQVELVAHLESKAYQREMKALAKLFSGKKGLPRGANADLPSVAYSSALIWKRYRKVCKIAAGIDDRTADEEVHRLRIHCKKLRYLMEFFAPVFPPKAFKSLIKPLKRLQDNLGLFNDYSVQQDNLRRLLGDLEAQPDAHKIDIAQSVGALIVVLNEKQQAERARVVDSFAAFNGKRTRETFQRLFHDRKAEA